MAARRGLGAVAPTRGRPTVRRYRASDAARVGCLIADTYAGCNLTEFDDDRRAEMLGPFAHSGSEVPEHRRAIADAIASEIVLVAEEQDQIVGVLRGRRGRLATLFVDVQHHRRGIGAALVARFEGWVAARGGGPVKVSSTLFGVPFYRAMGYRRTTGVRVMRSFDGAGLPYQPMKKDLAATTARSAH